MDLKDYLEKYCINKTQFARRLGISKQHLYRILGGAKCSDQLDQKIQEFLNDENQLALFSLQKRVKVLEDKFKALQKSLGLVYSD